MKILATLPDNMLNLSVHEMMEATRDFGLSKHEGTFKLDINLNDFWEIDNLDYDIIHIHWPEALVDWKIPTENDIKKLNNRLKQLKTQEKKIIITRHNAIPHTKTKLDAALYKTAFSFADAIFHMEKFSYNEYKEFYGEFNWYTKQKHFFAPIIMYSKLPNTISKIEARAALNINPNKFMYLVIGSIRNKKEKSY